MHRQLAEDLPGFLAGLDRHPHVGAADPAGDRAGGVAADPFEAVLDDRVDVVLTRQIDKGSASTEVVLQNARVLAVDQTADERAAKATVAKSVTLEVSTVEAQKVWLASSVGNLSLLLRKAGETAETRTRKITLNDLSSNDPVVKDKDATATVVVTRAAAKQEYTVPVEGSRGDMSTTGLGAVAR